MMMMDSHHQHKQQQYASSSAAASILIATHASASPPASPPNPPSVRTSSRGFRRTSSTAAGYAARGGRSATSSRTPRTPSPRSRSVHREKGKQPLRPRYSPDSPHTITAAAAARNDDRDRDYDHDELHRHSHGLSWYSTTRDSVVDNLLSSFDTFDALTFPQADFGAMNEHDDLERQNYLLALSSTFPANIGSQRNRGHTHSSSDSEYARQLESPGNRSLQSGKGRRSNSNSISGGRPHLASRLHPNGNGNARRSADTQRTINDKSSVFGARGNGGGSNSYGNGAMLDTWAGDRSMEHLQSDSDEPSVLTRGRPVPSVHSRYESRENSDADAAPEPVIAAGPRKQQNPGATGPVYVNAANPKAPKPSQLRKTTTQDNLRLKAAPPPSPIPPEVRTQAADFIRTETMRSGVTASSPPSAPNSVAPSPGISTRRKDPSPPRERPGFFKRVFGGGSSRVVSTPMERPVSKQVAQNTKPDPPVHSLSQTSPSTPQPNADVHQTSSANMPAATQTLNKKPSSFFRRRKKSASEPFPFAPPPLPKPAESTMNQAAQPTSSMSSLRQVMDPYLAQEPRETMGTSKLKDDTSVSRPATSDTKTEDSEDPDIFHSGYTSPLDAPLGDTRNPISIEQGSPTSKLKIKKRKPEALVTTSSQGRDQDRDPSRDTPRATLYDHNNEAAIVSPITDTMHPDISPDYDDYMSDRRPSTGDRIIGPRENASVQRGSDLRDFSAGTNVNLSMEEDWYIRPHANPERRPSRQSDRLVLRPTSSEEQLGRDSDLSTIDDSIVSPVFTSDGSVPGSATTAPQLPPTELEGPAFSSSLLLPTLALHSDTISHKSDDPTVTRAPSPLMDAGAEYRERARKIYEGDEEDVSKNDAASWLGERNTLSTKTLSAYMQLFDFSGLNPLAALRLLCSKLVLRGETQQFDRIITALSARWCECNSNHGFKAQDVIHTIFYSVILLNTDLHLADIEERMSRSAYVKNTLPTIRRVVQDAAPDAFTGTLKPTPTSLRPTMPWVNTSLSEFSSTSPLSPASPAERAESSPVPDAGPAPVTNLVTKRLSVRPSAFRNDSDSLSPETAANGVSNSLVNQSWTGNMRGWENEVEMVLKTFYTSIQKEPLPLHGVSTHDVMGNRNLSVVDLSSTLRRSGSVVSKAPSDTMSSMSYRSNSKDFRSNMRWPGRNSRTRHKLYPPSTLGSSRTSFDDGSGFWSPAQSSKYSFNKTLTSASVGSFSNLSAMTDFKHSIGFANALSSAIIREETSGGDAESFSQAGGLLEDESLALAGAPWAKEGLLKHKHHLDAPDRKSKERNWNDCFAVISKGKLTLFAFGTSPKSQSVSKKTTFGRSGKAASVTGARVGGGDWMENAEQLDVFVLRQTIASTLPPPGYSKARPHVWALSLPNGAVHLFQVGTPEIATEFMTTANYWSARLSKEPLAGGVSNIEYGWSEQIVNPALIGRPEPVNAPPSSMTTRGHTHSVSADRAHRPSVQSSLRSSFDQGFSGNKTRMPADKAVIQEWQPPTQSMMASQLMEVDQLKQLTAYVESSEEELEKHNELKHAIELAVSQMWQSHSIRMTDTLQYSSRHPNFNKTMANWQRKSDYLLREIVKFRTYMDSLSAAQKAKEAFYAKKAEGRQSPVNGDDDVNELPRIDDMMGTIIPRGLHTSG